MTQIGVLVGNPRPASRTAQAALTLREVLVVATPTYDKHALAVEVHLRPVLTELGGWYRRRCS